MKDIPIIDAHHHFYDPTANKFNAFLGSLGASDYAAASIGVEPKYSVHVECMPDEGGAPRASLNDPSAPQASTNHLRHMPLC